MAMGSSISRRRHARSQKRGHTRPSESAMGMRSLMRAMAARPSPAAMWRSIQGMSRRAGQTSVQGASQSPTWSDSSSSRAILRAARMSSLWVVTAMPSAAGAAHEGMRLRRPSTCTTHRKHEPMGATPSRWHSVGISMPSWRAAWRIVVPASTCTWRPSIVSVTGIGITRPQWRPRDRRCGTCRSGRISPRRSRAVRRASERWLARGSAGSSACSHSNRP